MFRSGRVPPLLRTGQASTASARSAALPPQRPGDAGQGENCCELVSALQKELRDMRKHQEEANCKIIQELKRLREERKVMQDKCFAIRGTDIQVYINSSVL